MAIPNAALRTLSSNFIGTVIAANPVLMTFYVRWDLQFPIFNGGPFDGEVTGSTAINSDMTQSFTAIQTDITSQMLTFLNARYGVTFGGGQINFVP